MMRTGTIATVLVTGFLAMTDTSLQAGQAWRDLFDGASLQGWRGYKQPDARTTHWAVEGGLLTVPQADGADTRGKLDLITVDTFDEFELTFDFRISPGANSGVKYFVLEDRDAAIGHEFQIIDDERHADAKIGPHRQTGAFYDVLPPTGHPQRPVGQFNEGRVVVTGTHVEHWLNGVRILAYALGSEDLQRAIDTSKFKGISRFGTLQKGHILLQDHGDRIWFRNVRIRAARTGA